MAERYKSINHLSPSLVWIIQEKKLSRSILSYLPCIEDGDLHLCKNDDRKSLYNIRERVDGGPLNLYDTKPKHTMDHEE